MGGQKLNQIEAVPGKKALNYTGEIGQNNHQVGAWCFQTRILDVVL